MSCRIFLRNKRHQKQYIYCFVAKACVAHAYFLCIFLYIDISEPEPKGQIMTTILSKDEYMTERALAEMWGLKRNTLQKWRSAGVGPKFLKRVGRIVYRKQDIAEFEQNNIFQRTANKR